MKEGMEDHSDVMLREAFEGPVPDGGFCDRVMDQQLRVCRLRFPSFAHSPIISANTRAKIDQWPVASEGRTRR